MNSILHKYYYSLLSTRFFNEYTLYFLYSVYTKVPPSLLKETKISFLSLFIYVFIYLKKSNEVIFLWRLCLKQYIFGKTSKKKRRGRQISKKENGKRRNFFWRENLKLKPYYIIDVTYIIHFFNSFLFKITIRKSLL